MGFYGHRRPHMLIKQHEKEGLSLTPGLIEEILESIGLEKILPETEGNRVKRDVCPEGEEAVNVNAKHKE